MNAPDTPAQTYAEELPWLAFLYVSEELTPDEVVDFEDRLLTDQAAREAVAQAMQMTEGLWMACDLGSLEPQPEPAINPPMPASVNVRQRFSNWLIWAGSTVALAGLAFYVGWWFAHHSSSQNNASPVLAEAESSNPPEAVLPPGSDLDGAEHLIGLWTDSESLMAELVSVPVSESAEDASASESSDTDSEDDDFAWMLAAVCGELPTPPIVPEVMEN